MLDIRDANRALLDDESRLRDVASEMVRVCGMHELSVHSHRLQPQGISVVAMLAESHLSIHTWPEHGAALADIFTCGTWPSEVSDIATRFVTLLNGNISESSWKIFERGHR